MRDVTNCMPGVALFSGLALLIICTSIYANNRAHAIAVLIVADITAVRVADADAKCSPVACSRMPGGGRLDVPP